MKTARYGKHKFKYPSAWHELTAKQLVYALEVLENELLIDAQLKILYYLSNARFKTIMVQLGREASKTTDAAYELSALRQVIDFVKEPPSFKNWKFPFFKMGLVNWIGPQDLFENLSIGEFGRAEDYYRLLQKEPNNETLQNKFMACLYRPKKYLWFGKRQTFTEDVIEKNAHQFNRVSSKIKRAVMLNFSATRENLFARFKEGFEKTETKTDLVKYGWTGTINLFCTHNHIVPAEFRQRNIIDVLILFDALAIENKERKKQHANH